MKNEKKSTGKKKVVFDLKKQFPSDMDWNDPATLPVLPQFLIYTSILVLVVVAGWFVVIKGQREMLQTAISQEERLKNDYKSKVVKAASLDILKRQKEQVALYVTQQEKQLPSKSEMANLLSEVNRAGLGRGLQFEQFKPGGEIIHPYYAELPVQIAVTGKYQDIGAFLSDVAKLPRIVTIGDIDLTRVGKGSSDYNGVLQMRAIARTFRYLEASELKANQVAARKKK